MALAGTQTAAMLLLTLVIAAAAVSPFDVAYQSAGGTAKKITTRSHGRNDDGPLPLTGLTQCVGSCGMQMTTCLLRCYQPLVRADPVELPYCLLSCSNNATVCVGSCAGSMGGLN